MSWEQERALAARILAERRPRSDADFTRSMKEMLGVRAKIKSLQLGRFEVKVSYDALERAVGRHTESRGGFHTEVYEALRLWAFGISKYHGGSGSLLYGSGEVSGWRDKKRIKEWVRERAGVAPRRRVRAGSPA